jgi:hypothetical protein
MKKKVFDLSASNREDNKQLNVPDLLKISDEAMR